MANSIPSRLKGLKWLFIVAIFSFIIVVACNQGKEAEVTASSPFKNVYGDASYVGGDVCASCHSEQHRTFKHTGMGKSFDSATRAKSVADFTKAYVFDSVKNLHYKAFWRNDEMYVAEYRLQFKDTIYYREEKINYIIGSGQHTNSHFWSDKGFIYQAPMTWYVQEAKWGLPPGYETNNIQFSRKIGEECMTCHNSLPKMDKTSTHHYIDIPKGISCERCHGPGSIHVSEKQKGIIVDTSKQADYSIVNPKRLPWKLQIDICQRCHLQGNAVLKKGKSFTDFRPGMPLSDIMQVYLPQYTNDNHQFVMASHAERFKMSKCFVASNGEDIEEYNPELNFTCINCHNPHVSVTKTKVQIFNNQCKSCHTSLKKNECSENENVLLVQENNCVKCHMPLTGAKDIPHVSIHDHYIRKPIKQDLEEGKVVGLKSINGGDTSQLANLLAYITYYEKFDNSAFYQSKADRIASDLGVNSFNPVSIHYWYNKGKFKMVTSLAKSKKSTNAKDHFMAYQVGQSFYNELKYKESIIWFDRAVALKSKHIEYRIARIYSYLELNMIKRARTELNLLQTWQNRNSKLYYLEGMVLVIENEIDKAKLAFKKALSLDPDIKEAKNQLNQLSQ